LRNDGQYLSTSLFEHVEDSLHSQKSVWVLLFSDAFEEDRQIMVVIELLDLNFPVNSVLRSVFNSNRQIPSVVESSEFTGRDSSLLKSSSSGLLRKRSVLGLVQTGGFSTEAFSFFQDGYRIEIRLFCGDNLPVPVAAKLSSCLSMGSICVTRFFLPGM
jgi:hypothetical protein